MRLRPLRDEETYKPTIIFSNQSTHMLKLTQEHSFESHN